MLFPGICETLLQQVSSPGHPKHAEFKTGINHFKIQDWETIVYSPWLKSFQLIFGFKMTKTSKLTTIFRVKINIFNWNSKILNIISRIFLKSLCDPHYEYNNTTKDFCHCVYFMVKKSLCFLVNQCKDEFTETKFCLC